MPLLQHCRKSAAAIFAVALLAGTAAEAGGPLLVRNTGAPFVWNNPTSIPYRTDNGPMSPTVNEAAAQARVLGMFNVWLNVATANISYNRAGFINAVVGFADGDVSTPAEYAAVDGDCGAGNQNPVIYDVDGSIVDGLGLDETSVIGFAGPCATNGTQIVSGEVVMNGLFQDGQAAPVQDISSAEFDAALIHEIGHFSGLDHSQVNVNCLTPCGNDDLTGLPTMFPFLVHVSQGSLSVDDIAWISRLYPQTGGGTTFASTHGTISGTVFFGDGESHAQFVNVIARRVNAGANEDRTTAVAVISGLKFSAFHGNPITGDVYDNIGTEAPGDIGLFEIPVPIGNYTVQVESIAQAFIDGSSIGRFQIAMPGTAPPPIGPIAVAAGATAVGNNVTLIGTPPRFDQFEGP